MAKPFDPARRDAAGIYLGLDCDPLNGRLGEEVAYTGDRHVLLFGPSGCGKGRRFLIPNLLTMHDRSVVVIDPKGELAAVTARYRHETLKHNVKVLDPFGVLASIAAADPKEYDYLIRHDLVRSAGFNPLDTLDPGPPDTPSPHFFDDAAALGEALIKVDQKADPHWSESAQGLMTGLVMFAKWREQPNQPADLDVVRQLLSIDLKGTAQQMAAAGYEMASLASRFENDTDEISSIVSTADTQTRWMLSPPMREDIRSKPGSIDFRTLKYGDKPTTIYVILPAQYLRTHSVWLRLVIVSALRALYGPRGKWRTLFLIDEMAAIGHLGPLEDAFGLVRGYDIQIAGILQDLPQLKSLYGERADTFAANAGVVMGFAPNDPTTAEWMSKRSGIDTVIVEGFSANTALAGGSNAGQGLTQQQVARALFLPQEVMQLAAGVGLLWMPYLRHTGAFFVPDYDNVTKLKGRGSRNPYSQH